ncbi:GNAT family N-acetyltransferase [Marinomonas ostreistagni]|uniref:GNAT family N-acetyltransferase n=1 Tax=Marinomonas ostreistagni TaxID=359209 RepID=UPI001952743C|nr:GNAT family N-acetyltransferase [Marinomonas ostreistagni]MBM6551422.1 tRNA(Met) cytidine acetyltransferase [Marinomonas ostreistagni]
MLHPAHRHGVLAQSSWSETLQRFQLVAEQVEQHLVVTAQDLSAYDVNCCDFKALKNKLGQSFDAVLLDLSHGLHLNALAILLGTVKGGGIFVLHLGPNWLEQPDQELARFLPWPLISDNQPSHYKSLFYQTLKDESAFTASWPTTLAPVTLPSTELNSDQQQCMADILAQPNAIHMLLAARGRGKSYALAALLAQAQQQDLNVACSASSPVHLETLKQHYEQLTGQATPFYAPDALLQQAEYFDLIVVDEAASVPLPLLEQLAQQAKCVVFSSTDYGYEGSGRGFGLSFAKQLTDNGQRVYKHSLTKPLRWAENDPLEQWLDRLLFTPYGLDTPLHHCPERISGQQWLDYPELLDQAFALLVSAHYQTSPENKRWLVDDPSVTCFCIYDNKQLIGVALVTEEGPLPAELAQQVMRGERRPRGHLLPQSLLAHAGIADAAEYRYWRISRIAVAPPYQQQGFGSVLLDKIMHSAQQQQIDGLATSFAATPAVIQFWRKNAFQAVRLGSAKDQASGAYSLMMLKPLSNALVSHAPQWCQRFASQWLQSLALHLQALNLPLILAINQACAMGENPHIAKLTPCDVSDLTYFSQHHRPYSSIRPALLNLVLHLLQQQRLHADYPEDLLLLGCGLNLITEKQAHELGYPGKKAFYQALKASVKKHLLAPA